MNLSSHSSPLPRFMWLFLILLVSTLTSCVTAPPTRIEPPLSSIRVVMDDHYPPYSFKDDQGKLRGILVDQWKLWEERTGVKAEISAFPWSEALQRMKAGEFDVIDTIFYTAERATLYDFAPSYARIDVPIFFHNNISGIADAADLKGFRVAVKSGDDNAGYLIGQGITDLVYYDSYEEIVAAAARQEEAIFVVDQPPALYFLYKYGIQDQFNHSAPIRSEEFHRAVKKGNTAVYNLVAAGFSAIRQEEYQAINQRWLGTPESSTWQQLAPYLIIGAALVLVIILILVVFSRTLQHRVRQRTAELEETLAALHDSRRFLADLIEYSGALIFVKDCEGRYDLINRKWEEVTGLKREDVVGKTDEVLFPGPIGQQFRANDLEVIETDEVLEREEVLEDAQGKRFFISIKFPVHDKESRIRGICGMTTEITERKQAEQALAESEDIFQLFMEHSPIYVFFKDEQLRSVRLSKNYERMLGRPLAELLDKTMDELFPSDLAKSMMADDLRILNEGQQIEVVEELNGRIYATTKFPIIQQGRPRWLAGYTIDITEQKRAEEALRQSEDKFSKAFHTSPDAVSITRLTDGLFFEVNQGFTAMMGYVAAEVLGKTSLELNLWANPADRMQLVQSLRERGQALNMETSFRTREGRIIIGLMSARPIEIGGEKCVLVIVRDITERKQAEEEIVSLSRFPDENPNPVLRLNRDGDIMYANAASRRLLRAWARITGDETLVYWRRLAVETLANGVNRTLDVECDQQVFAFTVVPILEGGYVNLYGRDVTERKQVEQALRESEQKMRAIVDAAPYGAHLYELQPDDRLVFMGANPAADQILHVDHRQFIGKTIEEAFPPLIETEIPTAYRRVAATGERYQVDQIAYDEAGISGAFELHAFQTGPNQMAVFFRDITERKQMEDALRVSLEKYRVLFESFPLGISITDNAGKILETNFEAEKLLGVPKAEHERRTYYAPEWKMVRSDGTRMPVEEYAAARALRENRLVQNVEMGVAKEQGMITWLSVTAAPIPLKGYGVAIAYGDITRNKEIEDELRRLNEDLEVRVAERTRELAEANARLTELDQLKSKFVSDVSHELRTPIANLKLYIDLLEHGKPEKQTQYIQTLHQQVRRVAALVDDILDLSRLEQRKEQGLIYRAVALNDVVEQVVQAHQPRAEAGGLQLTFEPGLPLPSVRADANQLAQVVTNLIANALSYTNAGYVQVSTFAQDAEVCLCVADSGSGIASEDLPHVFERFYRGQHVLKNDVPGTGLGLAIVKEIIDLHEGRIEVDSRPDHGTTFWVWLPIASTI